MWSRIWECLEAQFPAFVVDEWWGVSDPFARMAGAVLVQQTTWHNAAKALAQLQQTGWLHPAALSACTAEQLMPLIHSAGFQRTKAETLIRLASWLQAGGGISSLRGRFTMEELRGQLLSLKGIGPETADTILAYSFDLPTISGDAYARRLVERLQGRSATYANVRRQIMDELNGTHALQRLHGLIVEHGKMVCRKHQPACGRCLLQTICRYATERQAVPVFNGSSDSAPVAPIRQADVATQNE